MKKHLILLSLLYCTVGYGQEWNYTPFATTTPYPTKMKILKIGTVDMSLPENECPAKNWSFYAGDNDIPWFEYKSVKYNKGVMLTWVVAGWTMQELKSIEDSANGITYSFQIETWYDTVKPKHSLKAYGHPKPITITDCPADMDKIHVTYGKVSKGEYKPDTVKPKVMYGIAGIKVDSSKIYYRKYVALKNKGVVDSLNPYKQKLINYNKK